MEMVEGGLPRASRAPTPGLEGSWSRTGARSLWGRVALLYTLGETGAHHTPPLSSLHGHSPACTPKVWASLGKTWLDPGVDWAVGGKTPQSLPIPPASFALNTGPEATLRLAGRGGGSEGFGAASQAAQPKRGNRYCRLGPGARVYFCLSSRDPAWYARTSRDYFLTTSTASWPADYETLGRAARKTDGLDPETNVQTRNAETRRVLLVCTLLRTHLSIRRSNRRKTTNMWVGWPCLTRPPCGGGMYLFSPQNPRRITHPAAACQQLGNDESDARCSSHGRGLSISRKSARSGGGLNSSCGYSTGRKEEGELIRTTGPDVHTSLPTCNRMSIKYGWCVKHKRPSLTILAVIKATYYSPAIAPCVIQLIRPTRMLCPGPCRMKTESSPTAPSDHVAWDTSTSMAESGSPSDR